MNAVCESAAGGIIDFRIGRTSLLGLSALKTGYDKPLVSPAAGAPSKGGVSALGAHADIMIDPLTIFGELAANSADARSGIAGCVYRASELLSLSLQLRSYSSSYDNPHAYGYGEQNGVVNGETGQYLGMEYQPSRALKIAASFDQFTISSNGDFAAPGSEYLVRFECALTNGTKASLQFRNTTKTEENTSTDANGAQQKIFEERAQNSVRGSFSVALNKWGEFTQRIEVTGVSVLNLADPGNGGADVLGTECCSFAIAILRDREDDIFRYSVLRSARVRI